MSIEEHLCIKTKGEVAEKDAEPPASICKVPMYYDFFTRQELYQRIHVHIVGVRPKVASDSNAGLKSTGLCGVSALFPFATMKTSVKVETIGPNTCGTDYFDIDKHSFAALQSSLPVWDSKAFVISKKGNENTHGINLTVCNKDDILFEFDLKAEDFPAIGDDYKEFVYAPDDTPTVQGIEFVYKIRITDCEDNIVSKDELASFHADTLKISYSEEVIPSETKVDNALVQCWRYKKKLEKSKAILWVIGRGDCFMHPHVAKALFIEKGYDLYVLNYSSNGVCRKRGWVEDANFVSHNRKGDFDLYIPQIEEAIKIMNSISKYDKVVGYAHSTGGPILINYLMKKGDSDFDGFIFNSPFLDWSGDATGNQVNEIILENINVPLKLGIMNNDTKLNGIQIPKELASTPFTYLDTEIVIDAWPTKIWTQYYFDFRSRPLYKVPMTAGFAKGVSKVHREILKWKTEKKFITAKPFMCITSRADDVLNEAETAMKIDMIGPMRCEFELCHNAHDVFLSIDESDLNMALDLTKAWMECNGFI